MGFNTATVLKTANGWEPAFWYGPIWATTDTGERVMTAAGYMVAPGFARPTKEEAIALLQREATEAMAIAAMP